MESYLPDNRPDDYQVCVCGMDGDAVEAEDFCPVEWEGWDNEGRECY